MLKNISLENEFKNMYIRGDYRISTDEETKYTTIKFHPDVKLNNVMVDRLSSLMKNVNCMYKIGSYLYQNHDQSIDAALQITLIPKH